MGFRTVVINSRGKLELKLNYLVFRGEDIRRIYIPEISKTKLFMFINLKQFIDIQDYEELIKFMNYNHVNVLFIESKKIDIFTPSEICLLIDEDKCEFVSIF